MRIVLEWLGLVEPPRGRRDPVALPSWAPLAVAIVVSATVALGNLAVRALVS